MNVHFRHIILSIVASCLFAACQDTDVPAIQDNEETGRAENTVTTYLRVNLATVGESSSRGETDGYKEGTTNDDSNDINEATVKRVDFYFFDKDGNPYKRNVNGSNIFVLNNPQETESTGNVESQWGPVLTMMLKEEDVKNGNYPALMMAVVNSDQIYSGKTLTQIEAVVVNTPMNDKNVLMTSSSFYDADESENSNTHPYAVKISAENFGSSYAEAMTKAVDVYVERLAAKVTLTINEDIYNKNENTITIKAPYGIDGEARDIKIKLYAWGLNATAEETYLMKNIQGLTDENWWNMVSNHRSYWGKSIHYVYDENNYANSGSEGEIVFDDNNNIELDKNADLSGKVLTYHSLDEFYNQDETKIGASGTSIGNSLYTMEHMPDTKHYQEKDNYACLTSAILIAKIENSENLYRYSGSFWDHKDLVNLLYSMYIDPDAPGTEEEKKYPNIWKKNGDTYKKIGPEYFQLVDLGDGLVGLGTTEKLDKSLRGDTNAEELYVYYDAGNGPQYYSYKNFGSWESPGNEKKTVLQNVYEELRNYNEEVYIPLNINGFQSGWMYYNIPIEHIGTGEGQYGVVRNHWYNIHINKIENLGWGIFDPTELIVPIPRTFEGYGLSFEMQVCPWHVKEYNITLDGTN